MSNNYEGMCKGCRSNKICGIQNYDRLRVPTCPCRKCIVKGICIVTCDEYKSIAHSIFNKDDIIYSGLEGKKL